MLPSACHYLLLTITSLSDMLFVVAKKSYPPFDEAVDGRCR